MADNRLKEPSIIHSLLLCVLFEGGVFRLLALATSLNRLSVKLVMRDAFCFAVAFVKRMNEEA